MRKRDQAADLVTEESMLQFCIFDGCTNVIFGRGVCVQHDHQSQLPEHLLEQATMNARQVNADQVPRP
jgi:hypothetical protein